jgi:hypothetical protein
LPILLSTARHKRTPSVVLGTHLRDSRPLTIETIKALLFWIPRSLIFSAPSKTVEPFFYSIEFGIVWKQCTQHNVFEFFYTSFCVNYYNAWFLHILDLVIVRNNLQCDCWHCFCFALMMKGKADGGGRLLVVVVWERRAGGRCGLFSLKKSVCYQFLHCKMTFHDSTQSYQTTYKTK